MLHFLYWVLGLGSLGFPEKELELDADMENLLLPLLADKPKLGDLPTISAAYIIVIPFMSVIAWRDIRLEKRLFARLTMLAILFLVLICSLVLFAWTRDQNTSWTPDQTMGAQHPMVFSAQVYMAVGFSLRWIVVGGLLQLAALLLSWTRLGRFIQLTAATLMVFYWVAFIFFWSAFVWAMF